MKSFESEIKKYAEKTRLKAIERELIRDRILSYMEYHPLKKKDMDVSTLTSSPQYSDFSYISLNFLRTPYGKVGGVFFALFLIIGIPLLSERSVPGDVLYLVKTGVVENIRTQLASTPYEKVALETRFMERRIAEARLLASEGKLTLEVEEKIAEDVKDHAHAVQDGLAELRVDDADGAALAEIAFSSALEVQSAVLDQSEVASSSSAGSILEVVNTVRDEVDSEEDPTMPSYDSLLARVEQETTRSLELFVSIKETATQEEIIDIQRRIDDIDRSIIGAKSLKEADEAGAVMSMTDVLSLLQKLITFMTDIDVREVVALETLVPVIHTPEERAASIEKMVKEVAAAVLVLEKKLGNITDEGLKEKVIIGLSSVRSNVEVILEIVPKGEIDRGEQMALETDVLVKDLEKLTAEVTIIDEITEIPVVIEEEMGTTSISTTTVIDVETEVIEGT